MHITITGNLGSGKSTICKLLNSRYNFEIYSTGKVQRELAGKMNMTTLELNQMMRSDPRYDTMIDDATARISREKKERDIIFDSRLAWHFVESSFKVFVSVSLEVAAARVFNDQRGDVEKYSSLEEAKKLLAERAATESIRYKEIYNLNYMDFSNYDLVIDSTYNTPEKIAEVIMKEAKEYGSKSKSETKMLVSPKRLLKETELSKEDPDELRELVDQYREIAADKDIIDQLIKVKKAGDDYNIVDGLENVKAAYIAKVSYVPTEVVKD